MFHPTQLIWALFHKPGFFFSVFQFFLPLNGVFTLNTPSLSWCKTHPFPVVITFRGCRSPKGARGGATSLQHRLQVGHPTVKRGGARKTVGLRREDGLNAREGVRYLVVVSLADWWLVIFKFPKNRVIGTPSKKGRPFHGWDKWGLLPFTTYDTWWSSKWGGIWASGPSPVAQEGSGESLRDLVVSKDQRWRERWTGGEMIFLLVGRRGTTVNNHAPFKSFWDLFEPPKLNESRTEHEHVFLKGSNIIYKNSSILGDSSSPLFWGCVL